MNRTVRRRRSDTNSSELSRDRSHHRQRHKKDKHVSDDEADRKARERNDGEAIADRRTSYQPDESSRRKHGPERPRKDTLRYAFAVTDDIMPPQAIQDRAEQKRRELEEQKRIQRDLYASGGGESRLETMLSHGSEHLRERLQQMDQHDRRVQSQEDEVQKDSSDYISKVKHHAYESAKLVERIRQRAPKNLTEDA